MSIWQELGIEPTANRGEIRRAYAKRLKDVHPEEDPEGFQRLREAYEQALEACDRPSVAPNVRSAPEQIDQADKPADGRDQSSGSDDPGLAFLDEFIGRLLQDLARGDEDSAIVGLREALGHPALVNLELRNILQERVLHTIGALPTTPQNFAEAAVEIFGWHEQIAQLSPYCQATVRNLLNLPEERERLARLVTQSRHWRRSFLFDRRPLAAALLLGPYRPRLFAILARDSMTLWAMRHTLEELMEFYPGLIGNHLNLDITAWWNRKIAEVDNKPEHGLWRSIRYLASAVAHALLGAAIFAAGSLPAGLSESLLPFAAIYLVLGYSRKCLQTLTIGIMNSTGPEGINFVVGAVALLAAALPALGMGTVLVLTHSLIMEVAPPLWSKYAFLAFAFLYLGGSHVLSGLIDQGRRLGILGQWSDRIDTLVGGVVFFGGLAVMLGYIVFGWPVAGLGATLMFFSFMGFVEEGVFGWYLAAVLALWAASSAVLHFAVVSAPGAVPMFLLCQLTVFAAFKAWAFMARPRAA